MKLGLCSPAIATVSVRLVGEAVALGFDPRSYGETFAKDWIARRPKRAPCAAGGCPRPAAAARKTSTSAAA